MQLLYPHIFKLVQDLTMHCKEGEGYTVTLLNMFTLVQDFPCKLTRG